MHDYKATHIFQLISRERILVLYLYQFGVFSF